MQSGIAVNYISTSTIYAENMHVKPTCFT